MLEKRPEFILYSTFSPSFSKRRMGFLTGTGLNFFMALAILDSDLDLHPRIQSQALSRSE
jgi:hypothetical protein